VFAVFIVRYPWQSDVYLILQHGTDFLSPRWPSLLLAGPPMWLLLLLRTSSQSPVCEGQGIWALLACLKTSSLWLLRFLMSKRILDLSMWSCLDFMNSSAICLTLQNAPESFQGYNVSFKLCLLDRNSCCTLALDNSHLWYMEL
jgi:hypothetical protein